MVIILLSYRYMTYKNILLLLSDSTSYKQREKNVFNCISAYYINQFIFLYILVKVHLYPYLNYFCYLF